MATDEHCKMFDDFSIVNDKNFAVLQHLKNCLFVAKLSCEMTANFTFLQHLLRRPRSFRAAQRRRRLRRDVE
jgi:hypothetical protein